MTPALVTELKRLEREASPNWKVSNHRDYGLLIYIDNPNVTNPQGMEFVMEACGGLHKKMLANLTCAVASRNSLPALLEAVETMQAALEQYQHMKLPTVTDGVVVYSDSYVAKEALARVAALLGEGREK